MNIDTIDKINLLNIKPDNFKNMIITMVIIVLSYAFAEYMYDLLNNYKHTRVIYGQLSLPIYYVIIVLGMMTSLDNLGFPKTTLFTVLGTVGLTLALSLQNLFTCIIAGIYIGLKNLFEIGDYLEVIDTSGRLRKGTIIDVDLFVTTIRSEDMMYNIIPNTLIENTIINVKRAHERHKN